MMQSSVPDFKGQGLSAKDFPWMCCVFYDIASQISNHLVGHKGQNKEELKMSGKCTSWEDGQPKVSRQWRNFLYQAYKRELGAIYFKCKSCCPFQVSSECRKESDLY